VHSAEKAHDTLDDEKLLQHVITLTRGCHIPANRRALALWTSVILVVLFVNFADVFVAFPGSRVAASGVSFTDSDSENATFARLEELILVEQGCKSGVRLSNDCFTSRTNNTHCPVAAVGGMGISPSRPLSGLCYLS